METSDLITLRVRSLDTSPFDRRLACITSLAFAKTHSGGPSMISEVFVLKIEVRMKGSEDGRKDDDETSGGSDP
jgi:hypothetical protein